MNQAQIEINQICKWSKVLTNDAYGILLDNIIKERKVRGFNGVDEGLSTNDIDNIVIEILNSKF